MGEQEMCTEVPAQDQVLRNTSGELGDGEGGDARSLRPGTSKCSECLTLQMRISLRCSTVTLQHGKSQLETKGGLTSVGGVRPWNGGQAGWEASALGGPQGSAGQWGLVVDVGADKRGRGAQTAREGSAPG